MHGGEQWTQVFLDTAVDAIIVIDSQGSIDTFNRTAERMFGYAQEEVLGKNVKVLMPEPFRSEHDGYLANFLDTKVKKIIGIGRDVVAAKADGSTFPVNLSVAELPLDEGMFFIGIIRDLTTQKALERELLHAQKLEAVGRLAGALAHDFNNLLMGVISGCRMVDRMLDDESPAKALLGEIQKEAHSGAGITRQLLDFSRKRTYETAPCDLHQIVRDSEAMFRKVLGEDVALAVSVDPLGGSIMSDPDKMQQVMMNLIVNARDAMPNGGQLDVSVQNVDFESIGLNLESGPCVMLTVSDTGCGMDAETQDHIFEPFFTTKDMGKGTGLGLSTVFGLTQEFNGHIDCESQLGTGTTFRLYFPRIDQVEVAEERPTALPQPGSETILLVEDAPLVRAGVRFILQNLGYEVLDAGDSAEALRVLEECGDRVDLLLTDIVMPGMSGPELAERIHETHPRMRVLFMSAYSDAALVEQGKLRSGMSVLEKPFEDVELAEKIRELLTKRQ